jgi:predicted CXXCH cytochrome family protein
MRLTRSGFILFLTLVFLPSAASVKGSTFKSATIEPTDSIVYNSPFYEANERCFKCHGQKQYEFANETQGRNVRALMFPERIIDRDKFYHANHKNFSCTDCHSEEYTTFPHDGKLRMEQMYNCIDCHGNDEKFARYKFEEIDSQYQKSIHFKLEDAGFTCWECHDPHTYKISDRNNENIKETILYDNNICLGCHSNFDHFQLLTDREEINIIRTHDWLPNQAVHFQNVRCIECHTQISYDILVSHLIQSKDNAVKKCNECHSQNSILMATLYKFQSKEQRRSGFLNGIILNESYVIGANRNKFLNIISLVILFTTIGIICIHILFRIRKNKPTL